MRLLHAARPDYCVSEEPVVVVTIDKIHELQLNVVLRVQSMLGVSKILMLITHLLIGVTPVTIHLTPILDHAAVA
jgi:hypothetical protein